MQKTEVLEKMLALGIGRHRVNLSPQDYLLWKEVAEKYCAKAGGFPIQILNLVTPGSYELMIREHQPVEVRMRRDRSAVKAKLDGIANGTVSFPYEEGLPAYIRTYLHVTGKKAAIRVIDRDGQKTVLVGQTLPSTGSFMSTIQSAINSGGNVHRIDCPGEKVGYLRSCVHHMNKRNGTDWRVDTKEHSKTGKVIVFRF